MYTCQLRIVRMNVELLDQMERFAISLIGPELHLYSANPFEVWLALFEVFLETGFVLHAGDGGAAEAVGG